MTLILQALAAGILLGGLYSIIAMGISLTWGMLRIINLAHFSLVFLAAYITFQITTQFGIDPFLTLLVTIPALFILGLAQQYFFEVFEIDEFTSLLVSFGLFIILESVMSIFWTVDFQTIPTELNPYATTSVRLGEIAFPISRLGAFVAAIIIAALTQYILNRTYTGKALRALSQDADMAAAFGINHRRMSMLLSGVATAYAGVAGTFIAMILSLSPTGPIEILGVVFAVVILGGLGNTLGTVGAGLIIGLTQTLTSTLLDPGSAPLVTFSVLILALLFRPEGLFKRRVTL